jgi:hypothetical protein
MRGSVEVIASREIGRETVMYVDDIDKYHVAYKLVAEREAIKKRKSHLHGLVRHLSASRKRDHAAPL